MIKPTSSLFTKILFWFFLNLALVAVVLTASLAIHPRVNLHAIFGQQISNRLRTAGMLIAHDLNQAQRDQWPHILTRHAEIHEVDFALVLANGKHFASKNMDIPERVIKRAQKALRRRPPPGELPPRLFFDHQRPGKNRAMDSADNGPGKRTKGKERPWFIERHDQKPHVIMRTRDPKLYWTGIRIPLLRQEPRPPRPGMLLVVSDTLTGKGFFFDPFPWVFAAATVLLISALLWIPMVRHITRPLGRMTRATEQIAMGRFDVTIQEPRSDEIGRLARAINHMTSRLSAFVKGQKRFMGDVAHELGSPVARIQFGLGALEQRVEGKNRKRVTDVMEDVDHMSKLVNELLAFSRADMKADTVQLEKIDLFSVAQAVAKREIPSGEKISITIDPEIRVLASPELLSRAIANLLRNAVKYAGDGGLIYLNAEKRNNVVEIQVRDNGPGVPEEFLDQLFEPFFRPEASRDRDSGGVGLGLAIVKTCVETCRGRVFATNLKPNGFAVTITLQAG